MEELRFMGYRGEDRVYGNSIYQDPENGTFKIADIHNGFFKTQWTEVDSLNICNGMTDVNDEPICDEDIVMVWGKLCKETLTEEEVRSASMNCYTVGYDANYGWMPMCDLGYLELFSMKVIGNIHNPTILFPVPDELNNFVGFRKFRLKENCECKDCALYDKQCCNVCECFGYKEPDKMGFEEC